MDIRNVNHWKSETYRQRITSKEWKQLLLDGNDKVIFHGTFRQLKAKSLGVGVMEVYKKPLPTTENT